jgi:hypothetical protein
VWQHRHHSLRHVAAALRWLWLSRLSAAAAQADSTLPIERRRNYKSVVDALVRCAWRLSHWPAVGRRCRAPGCCERRGCFAPAESHAAGTPMDAVPGTWRSVPQHSVAREHELETAVLTDLHARPCRIVKEDGAAGLFTGAGPTVVRAMALNMGMLASNDQVGVIQEHSEHEPPDTGSAASPLQRCGCGSGLPWGRGCSLLPGHACWTRGSVVCLHGRLWPTGSSVR